MTEEQKKRVIETLNSRGIGKVCPMCGQKGFSVAEGYLTDMLTDDYRLETGYRRIPSILLICNNCGFMSRHALGTLGLMDNFKKNSEMDNIKWLKAAVYWINNMAFPNEGMTHPLDEDKLQSVANLLASLKVVIDDDVIRETAHSLHIVDDSIEIILDAFKKAQEKKFNIMGRFPEEFLEIRLKEIAKENGL